MEKIHQEELELIKKYGFALLPPRIEKRSEEQDSKQETVPLKYGVQCQRCGRLGMMSLEEMRSHQASHEDAPLGAQ